MTREEAIARIKEHKIIHKMNEPRAIYISEALDMAIKALEREPKTGYWIRKENEFIVPSRFNPIKEIISTCSICSSRYIGTHEDFKYCPNCGAKMIESEEI